MVNFQLNRYLKTNHEDCSKKLQRATEIISSLGGEKDRWAMAAEQMDECSKSLTGNFLVNYNGMSSISEHYISGDVLISSGVIAYLGAFTYELRIRQIKDWINKCSEFGIVCNT